jgi:hypothetical protein
MSPLDWISNLFNILPLSISELHSKYNTNILNNLDYVDFTIFAMSD